MTWCVDGWYMTRSMADEARFFYLRMGVKQANLVEGGEEGTWGVVYLADAPLADWHADPEPRQGLRSFYTELAGKINTMTRDEAERWLLGAALLSPGDVLPGLRERYGDWGIGLFESVSHREIMDAMQWIHSMPSESKPEVNVVTVVEKLKGRGSLAEVGGAAYLISLQCDCPMIGLADRYEEFLFGSDV